MSDTFVTVMTFDHSFEAQLAKNLLETEGINAMVSGELSSDVLSGTGLGNQVALQVHEEDAQRAVGLLAAVAAAKLDEDWEEQAESGAGVWTCSIWGEPISNRLSVCHSCLTPREGIRADAPRQRTAIQPNPATLPTGEEVQKRDEIAKTPAPSPALPSPNLDEEEDTAEQPDATTEGDNLARYAFWAAVFGILTVLLLPLSWYYLVRLLVQAGELSPKGVRYVCGALLVNGLFALIVVAACAGRVIWF